MLKMVWTGNRGGGGGEGCTDKKENQIFLMYEEIQNGAGAKSYMTIGLFIYINICAFSHILGSPSSYITLQLLHSEFPYTVYEENFILFFISVRTYRWITVLLKTSWRRVFKGSQEWEFFGFDLKFCTVSLLVIHK